MPQIQNARDITKAIIAVVLRGLRSGKTIKEIVMISGETHENIRVIMHRYPEVHKVYVETYRLRHPDKETLPKRMSANLREV